MLFDIPGGLYEHTYALRSLTFLPILSSLLRCEYCPLQENHPPPVSHQAKNTKGALLPSLSKQQTCVTRERDRGGEMFGPGTRSDKSQELYLFIFYSITFWTWTSCDGTGILLPSRYTPSFFFARVQHYHYSSISRSRCFATRTKGALYISYLLYIYFLQPGSIPLHRLLAFPTKQNKNKRKKEKEKRKKKGKTKGKRKKWRNKIKTHQERAMPSRSFFVDSGGSIVHSRGVALLRGR